jgi:hypothetical protein
MAGRNPFGDDPFPDAARPGPASRLRHAATRVRQLQHQVGHDGLTPAGTRMLLEELSKALDACADALGEPSLNSDPFSPDARRSE